MIQLSSLQVKTPAKPPERPVSGAIPGSAFAELLNGESPAEATPGKDAAMPTGKSLPVSGQQLPVDLQGHSAEDADFAGRDPASPAAILGGQAEDASDAEESPAVAFPAEANPAQEFAPARGAGNDIGDGYRSAPLLHSSEPARPGVAEPGSLVQAPAVAPGGQVDPAGETPAKVIARQGDAVPATRQHRDSAPHARGRSEGIPAAANRPRSDSVNLKGAGPDGRARGNIGQPIPRQLAPQIRPRLVSLPLSQFGLSRFAAVHNAPDEQLRPIRGGQTVPETAKQTQDLLPVSLRGAASLASRAAAPAPAVQISIMPPSLPQSLAPASAGDLAQVQQSSREAIAAKPSEAAQLYPRPEPEMRASQNSGSSQIQGGNPSPNPPSQSAFPGSQAAAPATPTAAQADAPLQPQGATSSPSFGARDQARAHDFTMLVDRLVEAREAARGGSLQVAVMNKDFGEVSLRFAQHGGNLTVSFSNGDPEFARAVQSAIPAGETRDGNGSSQGERRDFFNQQHPGRSQAEGDAADGGGRKGSSGDRATAHRAAATDAGQRSGQPHERSRHSLGGILA